MFTLSNKLVAGIVATTLLTSHHALAAVTTTGNVAPDPTTTTSGTDLQIGVGGMGLMTVDGGSDILSRHSFIGSGLSGNGTATITGTGSTWANSGVLYLGELSGRGELNILLGGHFSGHAALIGSDSNSTGFVTVHGVGSLLTTNGGQVEVGRSGHGTLSITGGGVVNSDDQAAIAGDPGSTGVATVDGLGSSWTSSREMAVGRSGHGTLNIINGGNVSNARAAIGGGDFFFSSGTGVVMVDGIGSTWMIAEELIVGDGGFATLTINGGTVDVLADMLIAEREESSGSVTLAGGTLDLSGADIRFGEGSYSFSFTDGELRNVGTFSDPSLPVDLVQDGGILAAGHEFYEINAMNLSGGYTQNFGTLEVELAGNGGMAGTDFDYYNVSGDATLAGSIDILSYLGFLPNDGDTFDVLTAASIFDSGISLTGLPGFAYTIIPGGNGDILQLQYAEPIPEPSGSLLLLIGFPWLIRYARRRGCRSLHRRQR